MKNLENRCAFNVFSKINRSGSIVFTIALSGLKSGRWEGLFKQASQSTGLEGSLDVT